MINIIYKISFERIFDFEYLISILKENYNKLLFIGNKRNYPDNQKKYENNKNTDILKYINDNYYQKNNKNEIKKCEIIDNFEKQNDEIKKFKAIKFFIENTNNINNGNNSINLKDGEEFGDIKKVIRFKKGVYVNKHILHEKNNNKKIRKKRDINYKRISKYRGVSKNGAGWQTLMMFNNNKPYIGTYNSEELAARIYDVSSIKKIGIKSKTNFLYTNEQIEKILKTDINFNDPNISKIISKLIE